MTTPWFYHPFFKYATGTLLILTILLVFSYDANYLSPVVDFISILFIPIAVSFLLYYLLRPIVRALEKTLKIPRWVVILFIYLLTGILITTTMAYAGPILVNQMGEIANISIETIGKMKGNVNTIVNQILYFNFGNEIDQRFFDFLQKWTANLSNVTLALLTFLTRVALILAVIPFIVFYLLKDDDTFASKFLENVPEDFDREIRKVLHNMDKTLSNYIIGLLMVSSCIGLMLFLGYILIGLNYALILSVIAFIFMTIPFLGPFLAIFPALFVGLTDSPYMAVKVLIVFIIVQQIEANLISPQIIGQRLNIHPLTMILLLLAAGSLYGLMGLIFATPLYALSKVLIVNFYKIFDLHYSLWKNKRDKA